MTIGEWLEDVMAARKPLTPAQEAALRPVGARMAAHMETAPAPAGAAVSTASHGTGR
jgi:hypothetical protein